MATRTKATQLCSRSLANEPANYGKDAHKIYSRETVVTSRKRHIWSPYLHQVQARPNANDTQKVATCILKNIMGSNNTIWKISRNSPGLGPRACQILSHLSVNIRFANKL